MRVSFWGVSVLIIAVWLLPSTAATETTNPTGVRPPTYTLRLTLSEFSVLNAAEVDGLLKYGGSGDFKLRMAKEGNDVSWTVTIENPRLMELLGIFVGEKTVRLVQGLDPNNITPEEKVALQAIKSLSHKLDQAQQNPVWEKTKLLGTVRLDGTNWVLQVDDEMLQITGDQIPTLGNRNGTPIIAEGYLKTRGQFELLSHLEKRANTLELFVMSHCPFGQKAETKLLGYIQSTNCPQRPKLEVRYIFYKQQKDGKDVYVSLHGDEEIMENLVQMILRDRYAALFEPYLLMRAASPGLPWKKLLEQAGVPKAMMADIETSIVSQRDWLIQTEYDYVAGRHAILDGSPSYVWESERVADVSKVAVFKGLKDFKGEICNQ